MGKILNTKHLECSLVMTLSVRDSKQCLTSKDPNSYKDQSNNQLGLSTLHMIFNLIMNIALERRESIICA